MNTADTTFIAVDVETANADLASICQVGLAHFVNGALKDTWGVLVNPRTHFDRRNVDVHGLDDRRVAGSPTLPEIAGRLCSRVAGHTLVTHGSFDRTSILRAFALCDAIFPEVQWLDTTRVVRRTWPELGQRGYGLANITQRLGIAFKHHDAVEDARATGEVLLQACEVAQCGVADWFQRIDKARPRTDQISREGDPDGALYGHQIVFTGTLLMRRARAAELAASAGCSVAKNVSTKTTLLVVGDQDLRQTKGELKSTKHRQADKLIAEGREIRILQESDFLALVGACK